MTSPTTYFLFLFAYVTVGLTSHVRVMDPVLGYEGGPDDKLFDYRSPGQNLPDTATALDSMDTDELMALLVDAMADEDYPMSDLTDNPMVHEEQTSHLAVPSGLITGEDNVMKRAPESELLKILGTLRKKYLMQKLTNRMMNNYLHQYMKRK